MVVNPDIQDIAENWKEWFHAFLSGKTHVTYAGIINIILAVILHFQAPSTYFIQLALAITGTGIAVDEASHLFSN